ncbi:MAG: membrane dipeptidase [Proteobacteria bacterium]|nr:membrane dipeptidase [Pseudomonadota bacterium]MBI3496696.1 membrane dipeptidase [Pseudomonadota bacterium]
MTTPISEKASALHQASIVWDAHACLPLMPGQSMAELERHRRAGASFVSVNVGMDFNPIPQVMRVIAGFRAWLAAHSEHFLLAGSIADVRRAKREGKLAVAFDLEGSTMLADDLMMLALYRDLGVRQIHLAYNRDNSIAGGCHGSDMPLTLLGRKVVEEINRIGLLMDCSHSGTRTSMDVMEISSRPVIFSHSNPKALKGHARNITDEQIRACAKTGGVVALSGIGIFLGANDITTETFLRHVDYVVERIGIDHVGIGLDYMFERHVNDSPPGLDKNAWWPPGNEYGALDLETIPPERLPELTEALLAHQYSEADVAKILGGNMARVAGETWAAIEA